MMRRVLLGMVPTLGAMLAGASLAAPGATQAQCESVTTSTQLQEINGKNATGNNKRPVNQGECQNGAVLTFLLNNTGSLSANEYNYYAVFYDTQGKSNTCNVGLTRQPTDTQARTSCTYVADTMFTNMTMQTINVTLTEAICGIENGNEVKQDRAVWFLPMAADPKSSVEDVSTPFCYVLQVDTQPPQAPTGLRSAAGEHSLTAHWNRLEVNDIKQYLLYVDTTVQGTGAGIDAGGPAVCPSTKLTAGATLDADLPEGVSKFTTPYTNSDGERTIMTADLNLEVNDVAAMAVAAQDYAGNVGPLSNVECLSVVPTTGFWELYKKMGGTAEDGCACSTLSEGHVAGALPALGMLAGLWLRARRRKS